MNEALKEFEKVGFENMKCVKKSREEELERLRKKQGEFRTAQEILDEVENKSRLEQLKVLSKNQGMNINVLNEMYDKTDFNYNYPIQVKQACCDTYKDLCPKESPQDLIKSVSVEGVTLNNFEKGLMRKLDKIFEKHRADIKQLNKQWKERICSVENFYRRHLSLGLPDKKPEDYIEDIPIIPRKEGVKHNG